VRRLCVESDVVLSCESGSSTSIADWADLLLDSFEPQFKIIGKLRLPSKANTYLKDAKRRVKHTRGEKKKHSAK